jgi:hypothetical protein
MSRPVPTWREPDRRGSSSPTASLPDRIGAVLAAGTRLTRRSSGRLSGTLRWNDRPPLRRPPPEGIRPAASKTAAGHGATEAGGGSSMSVRRSSASASASATAAVLAAALLTVGGAPAAAAQATAPAEAVPTPTLTGLVPVTSTSWPFLSALG